MSLSSFVDITTNPNPLERPVSRSLTTCACGDWGGTFGQPHAHAKTDESAALRVVNSRVTTQRGANARLGGLHCAELLEDVLEVEVVHSPGEVANVELALVVPASALR